MPSLTSNHFTLGDIPGAGRGLIATQWIPAGTVLLSVPSPAAHVIFREYRKEVCAQCFYYDRGRTLSIRAHDVGKVFCSETCYETWRDKVGSSGVRAWQCVESFIKANAKKIGAATSDAASTSRPDETEVSSAWSQVSEHGGSKEKRKDDSSAKHEQKAGRNVAVKSIDPDVLGFLLSAMLCHHDHYQAWQSEVMELVMDPTPYSSEAEMEAHCDSFSQLQEILPFELRPSCTQAVCRTIASAASHNAFGIRSGSDDNEEYMGYGVWATASYFNHSCQANVHKKRQQREWRFYTAAEVAEGEQLCISYLGGDENSLTVSDRRARLQQTWGFVCVCVRCVDDVQL